MQLGQNKVQGQRLSLREPACDKSALQSCAFRHGLADSSRAHAGTAGAGGGSAAQQTAATQVPQKVSSQRMLYSALCGILLCTCLPAVMQMSASQLPLIAVHWSSATAGYAPAIEQVLLL